MSEAEGYKNSGFYQSIGVDKLQELADGYKVDDATLRQQAEAQYNPTYQTELEALRQQLATQTQSYNAQKDALGLSYEQQRRKTNQSYDESAVDLSNALTKRGLGRSSLVSTQGAYLENQRNQALADINAGESGAINAINEKIALLADQTVQSEKTMAGNYAQQIENRINELRRENRSAATNLQLQIATLQQQGYEAYQDWILQQRSLDLQAQEIAAQQSMAAAELAFQQQQLAYQRERDEADRALEMEQWEYDHPTRTVSSGSSSSRTSSNTAGSTAQKNTSLAGTLKGYVAPVINVVKQLTSGSGTKTGSGSGKSQVTSRSQSLR